MASSKSSAPSKPVRAAAGLVALAALAAGLSGCSSEQASTPQATAPAPSASKSADANQPSPSANPREAKVDKFAGVPADTIPQTFLPEFDTVEATVGEKLMGEDQIVWGSFGVNGVNYRQAAYQAAPTQSTEPRMTGPILAVISGPTYEDVLETQRDYGWSDLGKRDGMELLSVTQAVPNPDLPSESVMVMALFPSHGYVSSATCTWIGRDAETADMRELEICAVNLTKEIAANPI